MLLTVERKNPKLAKDKLQKNFRISTDVRPRRLQKARSLFARVHAKSAAKIGVSIAAQEIHLATDWSQINTDEIGTSDSVFICVNPLRDARQILEKAL